MQALIRSKSAGITGGRGTAGAGPGRDLLYSFADVLVALERQYPTYETDLSIRAEIQNLPVLPNHPKPGRVSELLADLDHWAGRLTPGSYSSDDLLFRLVTKLPRELWDECRSTAERKARSLRYACYSWSWRWRRRASST